MVGLFIMLIIVLIIIFLFLRKGYYKTFQILFVSLWLLWMAYNMNYHLDVINTREPNPDKTLPYLIAVEHMSGIIIIC